MGVGNFMQIQSVETQYAFWEKVWQHNDSGKLDFEIVSTSGRKMTGNQILLCGESSRYHFYLDDGRKLLGVTTIHIPEFVVFEKGTKRMIKEVLDVGLDFNTWKIHSMLLDMKNGSKWNLMFK